MWNITLIIWTVGTMEILLLHILYIITRETWKGITQTKMEGGTEQHLAKTDDWHCWIHRWASQDVELTILLQTKNTVFLFESFTIIYFSFHFYVSRRQSSVLGKCRSVPPSIFVWFIPFQVFLCYDIIVHYKVNLTLSFLLIAKSNLFTTRWISIICEHINILLSLSSNQHRGLVFIVLLETATAQPTTFKNLLETLSTFIVHPQETRSSPYSNRNSTQVLIVVCFVK